ncbi:tRNA-dihydrouridine synthase B [Thiosulfativibrio zosterae]|uniref:tRNA-dihydrouridine synthase n=2 Tax=Thiosulfativibrio zosterae TaxID=2675053 RepID=A0A6F8PLC7_9GAMM|nr:tRNA-dihydrouridine synthase B [Thiosulfativibrio zosterae]
MAGITDRVFRDICRQQGADYAVSEMVASRKSLWDSQKSSTRNASADETSPRIVQLIGTEPEELAEAAVWQASQGAQVIDINMGCPAKKVCDVAAGSALMAHPDKVQAIFEALVSAVDLPITVKTRTGSDAEHQNVLEIAQIAQACGLKGMSIHGRTRADKFSGHAEYNLIKLVKQQVTIPIIANGDISTPEQALFVLKYTASDGILIGRAAQGYPWIFREIKHYLTTLTLAEKPSLSEFESTINTHLTGLYELYGSHLGIRIARKHIGWYSQYLPNGEVLRKDFNRLETPQTQLRLIQSYFHEHT